MEIETGHKFELYPYDSFKTLLLLEINRTRRYKTPLTLLHLSMELDPDTAENHHYAELFAINTLDAHLRDTDIPCMKDGEFLVLMPATDDAGAGAVCNRLAALFNTDPQKYDRVSFHIKAFIGLTSLGAGSSQLDNVLMNQAATAMQHARDNQLKTAVAYSKIK